VLDKLIGRGKFGEVKLGEWWGTKVAVKYLHNFDLKENAALFQKEINVMKELHHPHIVQFLGWSQGGALARGAPVILMEYLSNGSVEDYLLLHGSRVGLSLRTRWALQMAQALAFLHNRKPNYLIHRKLAPSLFNIRRYFVSPLRVPVLAFSPCRMCAGVRRLCSEDDGVGRDCACESCPAVLKPHKHQFAFILVSPGQ
jgi:serine/threonine protein kinase